MSTGDHAMSERRMPVVYLPHGGGPWPFVELGMFERGEVDALAEYLRSLPAQLGAQPKSLLVVSAHWETPVPAVMTSPRPPMLNDYYGFPPESYAITWPAPGDPALAARVCELLGGAGFDTTADAERGFDHGTFIPLKLVYPGADVPATQLSILRSLDPARHIAIGRALAPLRDEGVLIVGSGMSFHNMRGYGDPRFGPISDQFDAWLTQAIEGAPAARHAALLEWEQAPAARLSHPPRAEEHLLPLFVAAGAAADDPGRRVFSDRVMETTLSAFRFG
jgi:aromatic ring-opening dioxygenase catalytic subunit (LigB family)